MSFAAQALDKLMNDGMRPLPVLEDGHLLGLLRRQDIARWL
ncbi:MAG: CBS domain-containing protein [Candidatus Promineifilaceae bacterium]